MPKLSASALNQPPEIDVFSSAIHREVTRTLAVNGPGTTREIATRLGLTALTTIRSLRALEAVGVVAGDPSPDARTGQVVTWTYSAARTRNLLKQLREYVTGS